MLWSNSVVGLVERRDKWKAQFKAGDDPNFLILEDYKKNRDSEMWRASSYIERMCEYILYLEENLDESRKRV